MAKFRAAVAALLLMTAPAAAQSTTSNQNQKFLDYLKGLPTLGGDMSSGDRLPVYTSAGSGSVRALLGNSIVTLTGAQTLTGKTLTTPIITLPTSCTDLPVGVLYNNAGTPAICGAVVASVGSILLNASGDLLLNASGDIILN